MVPRKRRGKIPALPKEIRDELNARLDANQSYNTISRWLTAAGHPGFSKQNLHDWKNGGYQDWCRENERIQTQVMQREWLTEQVTKTKPGELFLLIDQLFVTQLLDALFGLDTGVMKQDLANPRHYISMFSAYNRFKRHAMNSDEFCAFLQHQKAVEDMKNGLKAGLSDEGRRRVEETYNIRGPHRPSKTVKDSQG